jgi:hypothetical protein
VPAALAAMVGVQLLHAAPGRCQAAPGREPEVRLQDSNVAPAPAPPSPGSPPAGGPIVVLRANNLKARLQLLGQELRWQDVCVMPCFVPVDAAGTYRIGGDTIRPSISFSMPRPSGQVVIDSHVGSIVKHWVGIVLLATGVASVGYGAYLGETLGGRPGASGFYRAAGSLTLLVTGVVLISVGIPLSLSSTSVDVH